MPPTQNIAQIIAKIDRLPELPQVALRLSQLLENPNVSAEQLSEVVRVDPSLTTQILKLCNSAAYGFSRRISTVKEAIAILGFKVLKSMVYTIIAKITMDKPVKGYGLQEGALWMNSLTCAVFAKHIATRERFVDPELAFTAGLLRDIGKIILGDYVGASYIDIEQLAVTEGIDFGAAEEKVVGMSHTELGARIAEKWNLPPQLIQVIRYHHKPFSIPGNIDANLFKLITIVHLADIFTMMIGRGLGSDGLMYSLETRALEKAGFGLQEGYLERMMAELVDQNSTVQKLADSFK